MSTPKEQPDIGLALGGGGARGLAHIGVLKILEREGISVEWLAGTSMGGVIAAGYAAGLGPDDLEKEALHMGRWRNLLPLVDRSRPGLGLLKGARVRQYFSQHLRDKTFADLRIPLSLVAVDLVTGEEVALDKGEVAEAVRATVALPGVLAPVRMGERLLVDGGLLNNVPADVVRRMGAAVVIAVDVSARLNAIPALLGAERRGVRSVHLPFIVEALQRSVGIMEGWIVSRRLSDARPDLVIRPETHNCKTSLLSFHRAAEIIAAGEEAAEIALPRIRRAISERGTTP